MDRPLHRASSVLVGLVVAACSSPPAPRAVAPAPVASAPARPAGPMLVHGAPADPWEINASPDVPRAGAARRDAQLGARAAGFIDAFTNSEPVLTRDGKRVVFVSNRDGLPQLYIADAATPKGPATRLVSTPERVTDAFPTADGTSLLFMSDTGADELWSLYRVGLDGTGLVELTPGAKLKRDGFAVPDGAPGTVFFSARKMSESQSTVYSMSATAAGEPRSLYTDELPAFLSDVSPDGKAVLVHQYPSRVENYLLRLDVATGAIQKIFPAAGKVTIFDARFSPDGKRVYVATDNGADQALVLALDPRTGRQLARHVIAPATALIQGLGVAKKGGAVAVSLLIGNRSEVRLLDGARLTPRAAVKMPLGQGHAVAFSEDGTRLTAQWSTPQTPTEAFAIDVKTGKAAPLRQEDRPTLEAPAVDIKLVDIPAFDGGKIPTNVYLPAGEDDKPHPVIVSYHGGPSGTSVVRWSATTAFLLSLGYCVVEPNVRGSGGFGRAFEAADNGAGRLDAFKDIETSARWVAAQPWADKDRLVVFGGSYGGYTVLVALSRWPDLWRAGVDLFGVVDLKTFMATTSGVIRKIFLVEFGDPETDAAFLASISPSTDVDKITAPTFVYAGANDPRVPRSESDLIVKALRERSIPIEYMVADNEGHSLSRRDNQIAFNARFARFLETHLR